MSMTIKTAQDNARHELANCIEWYTSEVGAETCADDLAIVAAHIERPLAGLFAAASDAMDHGGYVDADLAAALDALAEAVDAED